MVKKTSRSRTEKMKTGPTLALFYCRSVPESSEIARQTLELEYGGTLRLFPIACSGRLDPLHLLRALEEFADAAYLITCPEGACRYFEGNERARKRLNRTKDLIAMIGLEPERLGMVMNTSENPKGLSVIAGEIMKQVSGLGPSPVFRKRQRAKEKPS